MREERRVPLLVDPLRGIGPSALDVPPRPKLTIGPINAKTSATRPVATISAHIYMTVGPGDITKEFINETFKDFCALDVK